MRPQVESQRPSKLMPAGTAWGLGRSNDEQPPASVTATAPARVTGTPMAQRRFTDGIIARRARNRNIIRERGPLTLHPVFRRRMRAVRSPGAVRLAPRSPPALPVRAAAGRRRHADAGALRQ